ncbi:1730_t:CDS:1, partial [Dentiscutata heterogama]
KAGRLEETTRNFTRKSKDLKTENLLAKSRRTEKNPNNTIKIIRKLEDQGRLQEISPEIDKRPEDNEN